MLAITMYRTLVIARLTFREAIVQPIYTLLLALGAAVLIVFSMLPFFTLGEDTVMYKAVGLDLILLLVLIATLFATSRSIFDEIEDRTMLTLMSKPVRKWEVLLGKYLGLIAAAFMQVLLLGAVIIIGIWYRIPTDYQLNGSILNPAVLKQTFDLRLMHVMGFIPNLLLVWLQIAALAAISVALSVRFSLVVNLPVVIVLYIGGNLSRFLYPLDAQSSVVTRTIAWVVSAVVPFLQVFDFRQNTIYRDVAVPFTEYMDPQRYPYAVSFGLVWGYVGVAMLYCIAYAVFALGSGLILFENRELGGNEG